MDHTHIHSHLPCTLQVPVLSEMAPATKIDGKAAAARVRAEVKADIECAGIRPCLAVVLVGERPDSATYVATKEKACEE